MQLSPERTALRLAEVGDAILEARADMLAADLAGNTDAAAEHEATMNRGLEYRAALVAGHVTISEDRT